MTLVAEAISLRFGSAHILRDITLAASCGEVLGLIGPNGAGKSSLLSILSGERTPSAGRVTFAGRPLGAWPPAALARQRAVMPQASSLAFDFTVREIVGLARLPHGGLSDSAKDRGIVEHTLALLEIDHLAERRWSQISGGERQRVLAARAMAQVWEVARKARPRFLLLDEPTSNLDLRHQQAVLVAMRSFIGPFAGAVVVLHDVNLAALYCDRVAVMADGRVLACGTAAETLGEELLREVYRIGVRRVPRPDSPRPAFLVEGPPAGSA
jgi:iron complex transport system ATP-binding protein